MSALARIYQSPLALGALSIAAAALLFLGATLLWSRTDAPRERLREALPTVAAVLTVCATAVVAVVRGLAR